MIYNTFGGNADQIPVYFDMSSNYTVKSIVQ